MKKQLTLALSAMGITALICYLAVSCRSTHQDDFIPPTQPESQGEMAAAPASTIVVRARGTNGTEHIRLTVGGTAIGNWTLTTAYANYSATTEGTGAIQVQFDNDATGRDVQVDYITVGGTTRQAEAQATNTAYYANGRCGGGSNSEMMHCNGYIAFGDVGGGTNPGTCTLPVMPSYASLPGNTRLPDPFKFLNGTRMTSKADWTCRRAEIAALAQEFEFGYKPNTAYSATTGSYSSNNITVTVNDNGKTISFTCNIQYPTTSARPCPAIIGVGGSNLNNTALRNLGVAIITFPNNDIAAQNNAGSRGQGKFYTMYGSNHSAGALMAWAWGVSRLIDALEKTPAANIDASRIGVTGCSRNGKGALTCGAYDERVKLTIPQESGSGGAASWRVSDAQKAAGQNVQTLSQIVGENCWFRANFNQFSSTANKLPFDHHMIEALCAPRALLVIENTSMEWLGNVSTWTTGNVARMVWDGLGVSDRMGFSQVGHGDHCGFPSSQQPELTAYVQKFLIGGGTGNTNIMKTDGGLTFDRTRWVDWTVPTLP